MRAVFAGVLLIALAACGGEEAATGPAVVEPAVEAPAADAGGTVKIPVTVADSLTLVCGGPFSQSATAGTLAEIFGAQNVVPETVIGPDGQNVNVTAVYPGDRSRRIEVTFANEEERTVLTSVTIRGENSEWTGAGGLNLGDGIATVERLNKAPFTLSGFGGAKGGYVSDWQGGALNQIAAGCRTSVRFGLPDDAAGDPAIMGEGPHASGEPGIRAAAPYVQEISIRWMEEHEY